MTQTALTALEQALLIADGPAARSVFTLRLDETARREAQAADEARAHGDERPLLGALVTVKDNFDLAGFPTTAGSRLLADAAPAAFDAPVVERLRAAGCVLLGRTTMTEFAFSGLGLNPHDGAPANPAIPGGAHIPGGSSSGAAASVGLGIARFAIGTDTGGSVRIPAAFCGLVGFKPTASAVSRSGVLPLSETLDCVGVIARDVEDCVVAFDVIRAEAPGNPEPHTRPPRLAVIEDYVAEDLDEDVRGPFEAALSRLAQAGVIVDRLALPVLRTIPDIQREASFPAAEAWAWHSVYFKAGREGDYDPRVAARIRLGEAMSAEALAQLRTARRQLIESVRAEAADYDALVWPTTPCTAPRFDALQDDDAYFATNARVLRNPGVANLLDAPSISLPCPSAGAPVGMMLVGQSGGDDDLLALAGSLFSMIESRSDANSEIAL